MRSDKEQLKFATIRKIAIIAADLSSGTTLTTGLDPATISMATFTVRIETCSMNTCTPAATVGGYKVEKRIMPGEIGKGHNIWLMEDSEPNGFNYVMLQSTPENTKYRITFESIGEMVRDNVMNKWDMDEVTGKIFETRGKWTFSLVSGAAPTIDEQYCAPVDGVEGCP